MNSWMKHVIFIVCVSLVLLQGVALSKNDTEPTSENATSTTATASSEQSTASNSSIGNTGIGRRDTNRDTNGMLQRSLYVAIGISTLVALYFIVRTVKTRGRRKAKKYGVIHGTGDTELQPLDKHVDEDEEDMTLFDVKDAKRPK